MYYYSAYPLIIGMDVIDTANNVVRTKPAMNSPLFVDFHLKYCIEILLENEGTLVFPVQHHVHSHIHVHIHVHVVMIHVIVIMAHQI